MFPPKDQPVRERSKVTGPSTRQPSDEAARFYKKRGSTSYKVTYNYKTTPPKSPPDPEASPVQGESDTHPKPPPKRAPSVGESPVKESQSPPATPHQHSTNVVLRTQSEAHVRSTTSWAQMAKTSLRVDTKDTVVAKEEHATQKDGPSKEVDNQPSNDRLSAIDTSKLQAELLHKKDAVVSVKTQSEKIITKGHLRDGADAPPRSDIDIVEKTTSKKTEYIGYTPREGPTQNIYSDTLKGPTSDILKSVSAVEPAVHYQKHSIAEPSMSGSKDPASSLSITLDDDSPESTRQLPHTQKPVFAQRTVVVKIRASRPAQIAENSQETKVPETEKRKVEEGFVFTAEKAQDSQKRADRTNSIQRRSSEESARVNVSRGSTGGDETPTSKISYLKVRFGSVQPDPKSCGGGKDHIVFPSPNKSGTIQFVQPEVGGDDSSENSNVEQNAYSYSPKEQPRDLPPLGGIRSLQESQCLFDMLLDRNVPNTGQGDQGSVLYQSHAQPTRKVEVTANNPTFEPPSQPSFTLPQTSIPRTSPRPPMSVKHSPGQQSGHLRFSRYPVGKSGIPPPPQASSRLLSLSSSPAHQAQTAGVTTSVPTVSQAEILSSAFSHTSISAQGTQASSALDGEFQNRGPVVTSGGGPSLPLQPLNQQLAGSMHQTHYHVPGPQSHSQQSFMHHQLPHAPCPAPYHYMPFYVPDVNPPYYGFSVGNTMRYHHMYHSQSQRNNPYPPAVTQVKNTLHNAAEQLDSSDQQASNTGGLFQLQMPHVLPVQSHMYGIIHQQHARDRQLSPYSDIGNGPADLPPARSVGPGGEYRGSRNDYNQQDLHMFALNYGGGVAQGGTHQSIGKTNPSVSSGTQPSGAIHSDYLAPGPSRIHQLYDQHTAQQPSSSSTAQTSGPVPGVHINQNQSLAGSGPVVPPMGAAGPPSNAIPNTRAPYYNQPYNISNFADSQQQEGSSFSENPQQGLHQNNFYAQNRQQPHFWLSSE